MVSLGVNVTPFDASFDGSIIVGGNLGGIHLASKVMEHLFGIPSMAYDACATC